MANLERRVLRGIRTQQRSMSGGTTARRAPGGWAKAGLLGVGLSLTGLTVPAGLQGSTPATASTQTLPEPSSRPLSWFKRSNQPKPCYDRSTLSHLPVTDLHLHAQPFGGRSIPYPTLMGFLKALEVRFALLYGIGQTLPYNSACTYYLDCKGTEAKPGLKNDFENAANSIEHPQTELNIALSMTFPDLTKPEAIPGQIALLDAEYPGLFRWMGEVNLHKEALRGNGHRPATKAEIDRWAPFMAILRERKIPLAIHADLGHDGRPERHRHLMDHVLRRYPNNTIIWMHMGLSRELTTMDSNHHIAVMSRYLNANPNLYLDLSWTVLSEAYFADPQQRRNYVAFINRYPDRLIAGTDFVAAANKDFNTYKREAEVTGSIFAEINDQAFRQIVLGQTYFALMPGMAERFEAPPVCPATQRAL